MSNHAREFPSRYTPMAASPLMSLARYEDAVYSAGGDVRCIEVMQEVDRHVSVDGGIHETIDETFLYIPGLYDEVALPAIEPGQVPTGDCGHPIPTGTVYVEGTGWCCNECEGNAITVLQEMNRATVAHAVGGATEGKVA